MTTQHNMPPMPKTWQERYEQERSYWGDHDASKYRDEYEADLLAHAAALAERIVALEAKCTLYAASLKQADGRVMELEAELAEWNKLRDPAALHVNLLRGQPARLQARELLHVAGYTQSEVDAALAAARQPVEAEPVLYVRQVDLDWIRNRYPKGGITAYRSASEEWKVPLYLAAQQPATVDRDAGIEVAAAYIEKKAADYLNENASTESDTCAVLWKHGQAGCDYYNTLIELAEELRSLKGQPATPPAGEEK